MNATPVGIWTVRERGPAPVYGRVFSDANSADNPANERTSKTNNCTRARGRKPIAERVRELITKRRGESLGLGGEHGSTDGRTAF